MFLTKKLRYQHNFKQKIVEKLGALLNNGSGSAKHFRDLDTVRSRKTFSGFGYGPEPQNIFGIWIWSGSAKHFRDLDMVRSRNAYNKHTQKNIKQQC